MSDKTHNHPIPSGGASQAVAESKTPMRDNLESIVLAILMVLVVRQFVMEAFKIPTGSMAPTLLGVHKEVRCPNCGWSWRVGHEKVGNRNDITCPNCGHEWDGAGDYYDGPMGSERVRLRSPTWLWNEGTTALSETELTGLEAANRVPRWGSRIFVNKFIYAFREPRRWEVAVFRFPLLKARCEDCGWEGELRPEGPRECPVCQSQDVNIHTKNYIKRIVGLPGENIMLANGDVYVESNTSGQFDIARKPPSVQKRIWIPVFDSSFVPEEPIHSRWHFDTGDDVWTEDGESGTLHCSAADRSETQLARFTRPVFDRYAYNGTELPQQRRSGSNRYSAVNDLRLTLTIKPIKSSTDNGRIVLNMVDNEHEFSLTLPVHPPSADGGGARAILTMDGEVVASTGVSPLRPEKRTKVSLANYDDRLVARIGGELVLQHDYAGEADPDRQRQTVRFGARNSDIEFTRVQIDRDIHYLAQSENDGELSRHFELEEDSYMVLGDNSPASSDSRAWLEPDVPAENLMGEAFAVFWPIHDFTLLSVGSSTEKHNREE
ncbi:MAG: S26 family signal peptidase [Candidatus Brocadiia bacterium]